MLEAHAENIAATLRNCAVVATHNLNTVELSPNTGYVAGEVLFVDGSRLMFFEFLRRRVSSLDRGKYRYHYMDIYDQLIFRYDNAPHHPTVATFPQHKHTPTGIVASATPDFAMVLAEAEQVVLGLP